MADSQTRLYRAWHNMKLRCYNPKKQHYDRYGGRGICVCDEWHNSFQKFKVWAIENGYDDSLSIDRIDVDGDYCPENCRWITMAEQQRNKSNSHLITYNGETHSVTEWAEILGMSKKTIFRRVEFGWDPDRIFSTPIQIHRKSRRKKNGKYQPHAGRLPGAAEGHTGRIGGPGPV